MIFKQTPQVNQHIPWDINAWLTDIKGFPAAFARAFSVPDSIFKEVYLLVYISHALANLIEFNGKVNINFVALVILPLDFI